MGASRGQVDKTQNMCQSHLSIVFLQHSEGFPRQRLPHLLKVLYFPAEKFGLTFHQEVYSEMSPHKLQAVKSKQIKQVAWLEETCEKTLDELLQKQAQLKTCIKSMEATHGQLHQTIQTAEPSEKRNLQLERAEIAVKLEKEEGTLTNINAAIAVLSQPDYVGWCDGDCGEFVQPERVLAVYSTFCVNCASKGLSRTTNRGVL